MKADKKRVSEISEFVGYDPLAVYDWFRRYREAGIDGLREKGGRGTRPLMDMSDTEAVKEAVRKHRSSIKTAKAEWERNSLHETTREILAGIGRNYFISFSHAA